MMRRASGQKVLTQNSGLVSVVALGSEPCAEHEFGISGLKKSLGMNPSELGIQGRTIGSFNPNHFNIFEINPGRYAETILVYDPRFSKDLSRVYTDSETLTESGHLRELHFDFRTHIGTAWDEHSFAIRVENRKNPELVEFIQSFYKAASAGDAAVWGGGGSDELRGAGLCIGIVSRMDKSILLNLLNLDKDRLALRQADENTGIVRFLAEASERALAEKGGNSSGSSFPFGYFALSPAWAMGPIKERTDHPVMYWLNPFDQENNETGWFTVEDLQAWTRGEGPVLKNKNNENTMSQKGLNR